MKKILSLVCVGMLLTLGLVGCAQTPPSTSLETSNTVSTTQRADTSYSTNTLPTPTKIQGGPMPSAMTPSRSFLVVINRDISELTLIADAIAARVGATKTELRPEQKGFMVTTLGSVLPSDILRDARVKLVLLNGEAYTPSAVTQGLAKTGTDKKKTATAAKKTTSKKTPKTAKNTKTNNKKQTKKNGK